MPDCEPPPTPPTAPAVPDRSGAAASLLVQAYQADVVSALAFGLRFDERGRPRKGCAWELATALLAEQLAAQLERSNFVVCRRPPRPPHST